MTPVYDWTRFDALRERLREEQETAPYPAGIARVRGRMADAPEPHDWTRFEALERLFVGAETVTDPTRQETILRNRATVREARAAFEAPERMVFIMSRHGRKVEALTPDQFVDLWRKGYR